MSRHLAPHVREIHGVDMTPAMLEVARREASAAGLDNATFSQGDATALDLPCAGFDGAIARFTIHHVPVPARLFRELARVVRPGGYIIVADHLADEDADAAAGPRRSSVCVIRRTGQAFRRPGCGRWAARPALSSNARRRSRWRSTSTTGCRRGSGGPGAGALIEQLAERPSSARCFTVTERDGVRVLELRLWIGRWRRPA